MVRSKEKRGRAQKEENNFTSFKVHSADVSQCFNRAHYPGTAGRVETATLPLWWTRRKKKKEAKNERATVETSACVWATAAVATEQIKAGINIILLTIKSTRAPLAHTHIIYLRMNRFCRHWLLNWAPCSDSDWPSFGTPAPEMSAGMKAETFV